jgi:SAM-dependent methyltransferase
MTERYDEAYYQSGELRGTQYRAYLEEAPKNRTYFEIAETIHRVFRPERTLEIGCATGAIVSHLATFGVDAHGIDVSDWAVENRLHPNVSVASVESLPFEDNQFDVVYSCHALEHIPFPIKEKAFAELSRVCKGFQFHMLPILESGPYKGDRFAHLLNLRTDPTHSLLFDKPWWIEQFKAFGWIDTGVNLALVHDNEHFELSDCQLIFNRQIQSSEFYQAVAAHNFQIAGMLSLALNGKPGPGLDVHIARLRQTT